MLSPAILIELLHSRRFGVEYQPIVEVKSGEAFGHEALARFYTASGEAVPPQAVFDALEAHPLALYQVEHTLKRLQIDEAPAGELFINLDPDTFHIASKDKGPHPLVDLVGRRHGLTVEIIENSSVSDADKSLAMADAFAARNVRLALDDIGAPASVLSLPVLLQMDFLKFDRHWWERWHSPGYRKLLQTLVRFAREHGQATILEGVETPAHWQAAMELGVDYVQGFFFRDCFHSVHP
ncbi:EAL domain, c-di-GMP-specific phosphodiesterase class I (or its enzymatically inactive variant) [Andreprevotia lacus DSM 23236]|jgi:EAL domain-containing protein (putative c-di-GMP-specific phosphodiesterase class I)|uniref:EAL domain, c-di-GMP-specific phosphodiesterase class I (Or its enzymatically inactive variant) n=1 Tax=Andreprevotia lacus DSM 23236 TaxID=1121001 RepID=A0A1W1XT09_9NEIS|nr:EAL domain-containing protein [Andreprevotia lacus]SMC27110.1 EAL domain, c-di-GMP-specific phosphodiesterase class I (or its enzymatically inactive variant) [Andreprevotia lacus DSM 23236]